MDFIFNEIEFQNFISKKVFSKINEKGLNANLISKQLGQTYSGTVRMLETGAIKLPTFVKLCIILDTPPEYFIGEYLKDISNVGDAKATVHGNNNTLRNVGVSRSVIVDEGRKIEDLEERMKYLQKSLETMEKLVALLEKQLEENKKKG